MLTSLALIFLLGMLSGFIFNKMKLPRLLGMILTGVLLGPYALNLLDKNILLISADLRKIALVIILTRAGLSLDINSLKKVGRPAILMCFIPAIFEILGFVLLGPKIFNLTVVESAVLGAVIAAVSPAVIVPRMLNLMENGYGSKNSIPQLIMAGASVDDIFVIVLFTAFLNLAQGESLSIMSFINIPISIVLGILLGFGCGLLLNILFKKVHIRDSIKVLIIINLSFLILALENALENKVPISGLLAIMSTGIMILNKNKELASRLSVKYSKLWIGAEVILFVLVGATVNINYAMSSGFKAIILILICTIFRMLGVFICLLKTNLSMKERIFCMIAYCPKATVQAAIGSVPLSAGLSCGEIILTVAVMSILITAPLGAIGIDNSYKKLLEK